MFNGKVYTVKANLTSLDLSKAGSAIHLVINKSNGRFGELTIGHGGVYWKSKHKWKTSAKRFSWSKIADILDS
jgi:hypothetical protein